METAAGASEPGKRSFIPEKNRDCYPGSLPSFLLAAAFGQLSQPGLAGWLARYFCLLAAADTVSPFALRILSVARN